MVAVVRLEHDGEERGVPVVGDVGEVLVAVGVAAAGDDPDGLDGGLAEEGAAEGELLTVPAVDLVLVVVEAGVIDEDEVDAVDVLVVVRALGVLGDWGEGDSGSVGGWEPCGREGWGGEGREACLAEGAEADAGVRVGRALVVGVPRGDAHHAVAAAGEGLGVGRGNLAQFQLSRPSRPAEGIQIG